jgi:hypothetical protein
MRASHPEPPAFHAAPRNRLKIGLAAAKACEPACGFAFNQRPKRGIDQRRLIADPSVFPRLSQQFVVKSERHLHFSSP